MTRWEGGPPGDARAAPRPLIGRERELGELLRVVADPGVRLVTITGRSGVGKSHLARELAARELPGGGPVIVVRSAEHTSELQSLMRISSAVFCLINTTSRQ